MTIPLLHDHGNISKLKVSSTHGLCGGLSDYLLHNATSRIYFALSTSSRHIQSRIDTWWYMMIHDWIRLDDIAWQSKVGWFRHVSASTMYHPTPGHSTKNCSRVSFRLAQATPPSESEGKRMLIGKSFFTCDLQLNCCWRMGSTALSMTNRKLFIRAFGKTGLC